MRITEESNIPEVATPASIPPEPKSEMDKLKDMTRKDRIWYIGEYYKFHIIGGILLLGLLGTIVSTIYRGSFPTVYHCIYMNSPNSLDLHMEPLQEDFAAYLELAPKETIIAETISLPFEDFTSEMDYGSAAKVSATIAAKDLDSIIGDSDSLSHYAAMSGCVDLESVLSSEMFKQLADRLVYAKGEDGISRAYGLDISNTSFADDSALGLEPAVFFMISNSTHIDTSLAFVDYVFHPAE